MKAAIDVPDGSAARSTASCLLAGLVLLGCGLSSTAAAQIVPDGGTTAPATTVAAVSDTALAFHLARLPGEPLGLADAVREALVNDTQLAVAQAELAAALGAERRQRGAFQPEIFGRAEFSGDDQPSASFFAGADVLQTERNLLAAGATVQLPLGTRLGASLNSTRLVTNSTFAALSPQYDTFGELTLVQPLLKGFGPASRGALQAAVETRQGFQHRLDDARLAVRARVELTYWALHAAERDLVVLRLIRDQADAFLAEVRQRAAAGLVGPAEEANARVFLAQQEQFLLDGEENVDALSDGLAILLGRRPAAGAIRFRPVDQPPTAVYETPVEQLLAEVLASSLELAAAEQTVKAARTRAAAARWQALPQLDLIGSVGGRGLAGTGQEVVIDFGGGPTSMGSDQDTGMGEGLKQVLRRDHPSWSLGLMFSVPLGGGSDGGERDRLQAEVVRAEQELERLRRDLEAEVRREHRVLERNRRRLEFAGHGVEAALEQVRIGHLQYTEGQTTAFELVRLSADLAAAQRRYSDALVRAASAAASLRRLTAGAFPADGLEVGHADTGSGDEHEGRIRP